MQEIVEEKVSNFLFGRTLQFIRSLKILRDVMMMKIFQIISCSLSKISCPTQIVRTKPLGLNRITT